LFPPFALLPPLRADEARLALDRLVDRFALDRFAEERRAGERVALARFAEDRLEERFAAGRPADADLRAVFLAVPDFLAPARFLPDVPRVPAARAARRAGRSIPTTSSGAVEPASGSTAVSS
jgi:hypothetical protein